MCKGSKKTFQTFAALDSLIFSLFQLNAGFKYL